jgi:hypothetical protein
VRRLPAFSRKRVTLASLRAVTRSCSRTADKSVNVRIYRLGAMPLDIRGALSPQTAASMSYSRISCSGTFLKISAKPTSRALYSPRGQLFAKLSARCRSAFCICSAPIRRVRYEIITCRSLVGDSFIYFQRCPSYFRARLFLLWISFFFFWESEGSEAPHHVLGIAPLVRSYPLPRSRLRSRGPRARVPDGADLLPTRRGGPRLLVCCHRKHSMRRLITK